MPDLALEVLNLAIGHERRTVVHGLSFSLERGKSLALVGGNGSGKTTLLRSIAGLLQPLAGQVRVLGKTPAEANRQMAWLGQFQNTNPLLPLRARDVVRMAFYPERGLFRSLTAEDEKQVDEALDFFEARRFGRKPISELSGGQRQRVYLAYVMARRADLALMDEPLSGLDSGAMALHEQAVSQLLARGATLITATHNLDDAAACDFALNLGPEGWHFGRGNDVVQTAVPHSHH